VETSSANNKETSEIIIKNSKRKDMKKIKLKRLTLLSLAVLFLSAASYAQKGMNIEILVDPGMTMGGKFQVPEDIVTLEGGWASLKKAFTFGLDAGASFGYNFTDYIGLSLGVMYSKQGQGFKDYTWTVGNNNLVWKRTVSLNYLKIPIQANYILFPDKNISFTVSAGFYVGFLLGYKDKNEASASDGSAFTATAKGSSYTQGYTTPDRSESETASFSKGKPYKSVDFGGLIGVGVSFKLTERLSIPIGINYQIGFIDVKNKACEYTPNNSGESQLFWQNSDSDSPNATLAYHNSSLELKIGLKLNL